MVQLKCDLSRILLGTWKGSSFNPMCCSSPPPLEGRVWQNMESELISVVNFRICVLKTSLLSSYSQLNEWLSKQIHISYLQFSSLPLAYPSTVGAQEGPCFQFSLRAHGRDAPTEENYNWMRWAMQDSFFLLLSFSFTVVLTEILPPARPLNVRWCHGQNLRLRGFLLSFANIQVIDSKRWRDNDCI